MTKNEETLKNAVAIAEFRFGLIAPVIQGLFPDASATAYYKRIAENNFTLPDGTVKKFSYKTIEDWATRYKAGGLEQLMPRTRSDKGNSRALNDEAIAEIYRVKELFPKMNATQIYQHLVLWSRLFVTLQPNFTTGVIHPRSVPQKAFCNCYKNADVHDCNTHTQILRLQYRVHPLCDNNAGKSIHF